MNSFPNLGLSANVEFEINEAGVSVFGEIVGTPVQIRFYPARTVRKLVAGQNIVDEEFQRIGIISTVDQVVSLAVGYGGSVAGA